MRLAFYFRTSLSGFLLFDVEIENLLKFFDHLADFQIHVVFPRMSVSVVFACSSKTSSFYDK